MGVLWAWLSVMYCGCGSSIARSAAAAAVSGGSGAAAALVYEHTCLCTDSPRAYTCSSSASSSKRGSKQQAQQQQAREPPPEQRGSSELLVQAILLHPLVVPRLMAKLQGQGVGKDSWWSSLLARPLLQDKEDGNATLQHLVGGSCGWMGSGVCADVIACACVKQYACSACWAVCRCSPCPAVLRRWW